jgi:fatty acid desaturase
MVAQADYVKILRPLLPKEAFVPNVNKFVILCINLLIMILGWAIARHLNQWSPGWLWLYLPLAIVMGNSIVVFLFVTHDMMHGSVIKNSRLIHLISLTGLSLLWMPPTLWKMIHNQKHHHQTNSTVDPDRSYLFHQDNTWDKWIQNLVVPSYQVNFCFLIFGMMMAWGTYALRNLMAVLFFNDLNLNVASTSVTVSSGKRQSIIKELCLMVLIHAGILTYLKFNPINILLGYLLPIWIGYAVVIFYIYTNHFLCPMTEVNDPLINSVSLKVPKIFDLLHFNFSYHTEHHIFPGINSDYYPFVQELLQTHYPEYLNLLDVEEAWYLLMQTPRHYWDETTLTDWSGQKSVPCPCTQKPFS